MDKIYNKIIKYGGEWNTNIWMLYKDIAPQDTTISVVALTGVHSFIPGDMIRMEIGGVPFICKMIDKTNLTIIEPSIRKTTISKNSQVNVLKQLSTTSPEDIVSRFELNRLSTTLSRSPEVYAFNISNVTSGQYKIADYFDTDRVTIEIYENVNGTIELSEVECSIKNGIISWHSMTTIPSAILMLMRLP